MRLDDISIPASPPSNAGRRFKARTVSLMQGPAFAGALVGLLTWCWATQFLLSWGDGFAASMACAAAVVVAAAVALRSGRVTPTSPWNWVAIAAWAIAMPWVAAAVRSGGALDDRFREFLGALTCALVTLGPGLALVLRSIPFGDEDRQPRRMLAAAGCVWMIAPITVGLWPGPLAVTLVATGLCVLRCALDLSTETNAAAPVVIAFPGRKMQPMVWALAASLCAGFAMQTTRWLESQLFLETPALVFAAWGGVVLGVGLGFRSGGRPAQPAHLGLFIALLAASYSVLIDAAIGLSASVSWLPAILGLRSLWTLVLSLPAGFVLGRGVSAAAANDGRTLSIQPLLHVAVFAGGWSMARGINFGLAWSATFVAVACVIGMGQWLFTKSWTTSRRWTRFALPGAAVGAVALAAVADPGRELPAQRMLFSGPHFQARAAGVAGELRPYIDDERISRSAATDQGVLAVWKKSAGQWTLRENGVTRGMISTNPELCPQPIVEVLTAVLPLAMHEQPHNILVTSAAYPAVVSACLACPVESITVIEDDEQTIATAASALHIVCPTLQAGDDRLRFHRADVPRGVAASQRLFDVAIAPDSIAGDLASVRLWSADHFRQVAAHLTENGVFCQRLTCFDLGMDSVLSVVRAAQSAFSTVQLSEVTPGEWLMICRNHGDGTMEKTFIDRLEKPHVREVLAQAGWDWSIVLGLKTVHVEELRKAVGEATGVTAARLAYSMPADVMRWTPKFTERRQWLVTHAKPLGDALGDEPALADAGQRVNDVQLAQQIVTDHPDQYWKYRHFVKKRLQDRPRPKVIQVAGELRNGRDPEDTRRMEFLTDFGKAAEKKDRTQIDRLLEYLSPFDPLVTPFVPREYVRLDQQTAEPNYTAEWRLSVRSVYFSPPTDRSVMNVCDALKIAHEHPEAVGSPQEQWDGRNALLEVLKNRWAVRVNSSTTLKYDVSDAERSLDEATTAIDDLDRLRESAGVSETYWTERRTILERYLVRVLRSWRAEETQRQAVISARTGEPEKGSAK